MQKNQKKEEKKAKKSNTHFLGGLENRQEVVPPFFPKHRVFQNSQKKTIFIEFPEKLGGNHLYSKRLVTKRTDLEGKNDNFLVPFRQKCLRRCQTKKRGGWGRAKPPPPKKGREKHSHGRVLVVFVLCVFFCSGCCCCIFVFFCC